MKISAFANKKKGEGTTMKLEKLRNLLSNLISKENKSAATDRKNNSVETAAPVGKTDNSPSNTAQNDQGISQQKAPESNTAKIDQDTDKQEAEISADYLEELRREALSYFPSKMSMAELETVFDMLGEVVFLGILRTGSELDWSSARRKEKDASKEEAFEIFNEAVANDGYRIDRYLNGIKQSKIAECIASASKESLLKAYIAADYYAFILLDEYNTNLRKLQKSIAREMLKRYPVKIQCHNFEELQVLCNKVVSANPDSEDAKELVRVLGKGFLTLDKIWILYDEDFSNDKNNVFP